MLVRLDAGHDAVETRATLYPQRNCVIFKDQAQINKKMAHAVEKETIV